MKLLSASALRCILFVSVIIGMAIHVIAQDSEPQRYALIIGISGYPHYEKQKLEYADDDAQKFYDFIRTPQGGSFQKENIRLLLNDDATRLKIYDAITEISKRAKGNNDLLYVFFAGHGATDVTTRRVYFMPYDGNPKAPRGAGIMAPDFIRDITEQINPEFVFFFIDACYAGAALLADGVSRGEGSDLEHAFSEFWKNELAGKDSVNIAFLSASSSEESQEDKELAHGVFTWHLIKGLQGEADKIGDGKIGDGKITTGELHHYLMDSVSDYAWKKWKKKQSPTVSPNMDTRFVLAIKSGLNLPLTHNPNPRNTNLVNKENKFNLKLDKIVTKQDGSLFDTRWAFTINIDDKQVLSLPSQRYDDTKDKNLTNFALLPGRVDRANGSFSASEKLVSLKITGIRVGTKGRIQIEKSETVSLSEPLAGEWSKSLVISPQYEAPKDKEAVDKNPKDKEKKKKEDEKEGSFTFYFTISKSK